MGPVLLPVAALLALSTADVEAEAPREPIHVQAQTYLVAPATDSQWLLGAAARGSVGRFGLAISGYQQAVYGRPGAPAHLGSLLVSLTLRFELGSGISLGAALGANTLFVAPDVTSIAPSIGFFSRFEIRDWLSVELEMDASAWPHYRIDALSQLTLHWKALTLSAGVRVVHLEAPPRLGFGPGDVSSIGAQVGLGVEWSG